MIATRLIFLLSPLYRSIISWKYKARSPRYARRMASSTPFLSGTIEADEDSPSGSFPKGNIGSKAKQPLREPVVLVPGTASNGSAWTGSVEEGGIVRGPSS